MEEVRLYVHFAISTLSSWSNFSAALCCTSNALSQDAEDEDGSECLLSFIAQLNPSGWIWESYGYQQAFLKEVSIECAVVGMSWSRASY